MQGSCDVQQGGGIPSEGSRPGMDGPHDSADSSTGLFRSRSLLPAPAGQLSFSEAWRMVRQGPAFLLSSKTLYCILRSSGQLVTTNRCGHRWTLGTTTITLSSLAAMKAFCTLCSFGGIHLGMCTQGQQGRAAAAANEHAPLSQDSGEASASVSPLAGAYSCLSAVLTNQLINRHKQVRFASHSTILHRLVLSNEHKSTILAHIAAAAQQPSRQAMLAGLLSVRRASSAPLGGVPLATLAAAVGLEAQTGAPARVGSASRDHRVLLTQMSIWPTALHRPPSVCLSGVASSRALHMYRT